MEKNGKKIIEKIINLTSNDKLHWDYMDESDPFYENSKEQFTSEYKISSTKKIDIRLTKIMFKFYNNYFLDLYYNSENIHEHIDTYYYQNYNTVFMLYTNAKFYSALDNNEYLKDFKQHLYYNWDDYKWVKLESDGYPISYETTLEIKNNVKVNIIVSKNIINIYNEITNKNVTEQYFLNTISDSILYRIVYENINK